MQFDPIAIDAARQAIERQPPRREQLMAAEHRRLALCPGDECSVLDGQSQLDPAGNRQLWCGESHSDTVLGTRPGATAEGEMKGSAVRMRSRLFKGRWYGVTLPALNVARELLRRGP